MYITKKHPIFRPITTQIITSTGIRQGDSLCARLCNIITNEINNLQRKLHKIVTKQNILIVFLLFSFNIGKATTRTVNIIKICKNSLFTENLISSLFFIAKRHIGTKLTFLYHLISVSQININLTASQ